MFIICSVILESMHVVAAFGSHRLLFFINVNHFSLFAKRIRSVNKNHYVDNAVSGAAFRLGHRVSIITSICSQSPSTKGRHHFCDQANCSSCGPRFPQVHQPKARTSTACVQHGGFLRQWQLRFFKYGGQVQTKDRVCAGRPRIGQRFVKIIQFI